MKTNRPVLRTRTLMMLAADLAAGGLMSCGSVSVGVGPPPAEVEPVRFGTMPLYNVCYDPNVSPKPAHCNIK